MKERNNERKKGSKKERKKKGRNKKKQNKKNQNERISGPSIRLWLYVRIISSNVNRRFMQISDRTEQC